MQVSLFFDKLYKNDRPQELCQAAIPLPKGVLPEDGTDRAVLLDQDAALPSQVKATALWDDGSVKYLFLRFLADLPGNASREFLFSIREPSFDCPLSTSSPSYYNRKEFRPVRCGRDEEGRIRVDTGALTFRIKDGSDSLFDQVFFQGRTWEGGQFVGPVLTWKHRKYGIHVDGWRVAEQGDVCVILEGEGTFSPVEKASREPSDALRLTFTARLTATAGKPWVELAFRFFNRTKGDVCPDSLVFYLRRTPDSDPVRPLPPARAAAPDPTGCGDLEGRGEGDSSRTILETTGLGSLSSLEELCAGDVRSCVGRSNYRTHFTLGRGGEPVSEQTSSDLLISEANEHFAEVLYGTFFADICDPEGGICATVFQAQQNFPKAVAADHDGIAVHLIPEAKDKVLFSSGMAREQRILLHFHTADEPLASLDDRSLIFQMPDTPRLLPDVFEAAGVMPDIFVAPDRQDPDIETALISKADSHGRAYGMMNWGDMPDINYTEQGRGGGKLVWTNNEYDYPHAMFLMYARTGVRRFLDYACVAARHWMDVDICHCPADPLRAGGQWEHTKGHTGGSAQGHGSEGTMVCSHEWVEGLLDLWHFTGDERAFESAVGIGDNVLRLLDTPMYQKPGEINARETGWALRTLTALFVETSDEKWLAPSRKIIRQFSEWKELYGAWLAPYTDNTTIRVGFMIAVAVGSLMRYYRVFPDPALRKMILEAVDDITENYMTPHGLFYYKELPSLARNGNNTLLLEAMAIAYELTGEKKYLSYGLRTFRSAIAGTPKFSTKKQRVEDTVLSGSEPTKAFAQSFLPLAQFYKALVREGMV